MKVGDYVKCLCNDKIGIITKIYMTGHNRCEVPYVGQNLLIPPIM